METNNSDIKIDKLVLIEELNIRCIIESLFYIYKQVEYSVGTSALSFSCLNICVLCNEKGFDYVLDFLDIEEIYKLSFNALDYFEELEIIKIRDVNNFNWDSIKTRKGVCIHGGYHVEYEKLTGLYEYGVDYVLLKTKKRGVE